MRVLSIMLLLTLGACSTTVPINYTPQSFYKLGAGKIAIGEFRYIPAETGDVKSNQIENSAIGKIFIATDVDNFVRRATALELERAGAVLNDGAALRLDGDILKLRAGDLGYSVQWTYEVRYRIIGTANNEIIFDKIYVPKEVKTGKFGRASDYTPSVNELVLSGIEGLLQDIETDNILSVVD